VRAVQNGTWKSANLWGGVREGMIRVGDFGTRVPAAVQQEVLNAQKAVGAGKLQPFRAGKVPVRDNEGQERIAAGQALPDAQILQMNWLVEGVVGKVSR
jgi:simple sugar transport system substrate-binding protein